MQNNQISESGSLTTKSQRLRYSVFFNFLSIFGITKGHSRRSVVGASMFSTVLSLKKKKKRKLQRHAFLKLEQQKKKKHICELYPTNDIPMFLCLPILTNIIHVTAP